MRWLPGRPLCGRTSVRPRLPHLSVGETKRRIPHTHSGLRLSHGWGRRRGVSHGLTRVFASPTEWGRREHPAGEAGAQRRGLCLSRGGPHRHVLAPRPPPLRPASAWPRLPHLSVGETKKRIPQRTHSGLRLSHRSGGRRRGVSHCDSLGSVASPPPVGGGDEERGRGGGCLSLTFRRRRRWF